jgi:hypothetical protein
MEATLEFGNMGAYLGVGTCQNIGRYGVILLLPALFSGSEGNHGCGGGLMDLAFKYIIKNDGIDKEEFYRYRAHVSQHPTTLLATWRRMLENN